MIDIDQAEDLDFASIRRATRNLKARDRARWIYLYTAIKPEADEEGAFHLPRLTPKEGDHCVTIDRHGDWRCCCPARDFWPKSRCWASWMILDLETLERERQQLVDAQPTLISDVDDYLAHLDPEFARFDALGASWA